MVTRALSDCPPKMDLMKVRESHFAMFSLSSASYVAFTIEPASPW